MRPVLDHLEKTLADGYRKEIDQEENVWRSLPFFAAGLALQMAALAAVLGRLADLQGAMAAIAFWALVAAGGLSLGVIGFMCAAIYPRRFEYIATEPALLEFALQLERVEKVNPESGVALLVFKEELARQYARSTAHNRRLNQRRVLLRSIAGLLMLGSVIAIVVVVFSTTAHYIVR